MIARTQEPLNGKDIWMQLSAPVPTKDISWRQDGRASARDGKYFARFVCYIEAGTVFARLDDVVPGEWDLTLELLPPIPGDEGEATCSFKARLQILGVIREDVGTGRDYKSASTDAFKRAAVRFGIGRELYAYEQNWVQVDGDGRFATPLEDPAIAYARRYGKATGATKTEGEQRPDPSTGSAPSSSRPEGRSDSATKSSATNSPAAPAAADEPSCPKCGGRVWDNRASKRNPRAPDFKCRDRSCDGVIWPAKAKDEGRAPRAGAEPLVPEYEGPELDQAAVSPNDVDDLPF